MFPISSRAKKIIIAAHGNSLRAIVQHLKQLTPEEIMQVNIPTGMPLVFELDENLQPTSEQYLGDAEAVKKAMEVVANQGKSK